MFPPNRQNQNQHNQHKIVKEKFLLSKIENQQQEINFITIPVADHLKINDTRTLKDFKDQVFGGYKKSQVLSTLSKDIVAEKIDSAVYWGLQLLFSGIINGLWDKLLVLLAKQSNVLNPTLPVYLWNRHQTWSRIISQSQFKKEQSLQLRNLQEIRMLIIEIIGIATLSRKRKLETLPKVKQEDFAIQVFKSKLQANDTSLSKTILKEGDPSEVRIAANEMAFHLKNRNMPKALYWLSWMNEWDKLNSSKKRFGRFDVGSRSVTGVDNKYHQNVVWLYWDIINTLRQDWNVGREENQQIDALWNLYRYNWVPGQKGKRMIYLIWSIKYMTTHCDWNIPLVDREYMLLQVITNINQMITTIKKQEQNQDPYQLDKFNIVVRNNYMSTQRSRQLEAEEKKKETQKAKDKKAKEAKKKKISIDSMNKLDALAQMDKLMNM